jgi:quercetin dioxygenase-like cupin family protein
MRNIPRMPRPRVLARLPLADNRQMAKMMEPAEALALLSLVAPTDDGIASRILFKNGSGNLTLFAFDAGQGLTEHTSPFDAFIIVLDGAMALKIDGKDIAAGPGTITRMPANVPHALEASTRAVLLLVMLRDAV